MDSGRHVTTTNINELPEEIKQLIFSFLTNHDPWQASQDILKLRRLSKEWNHVVISYLKWLWERKVQQGWVTDFLAREQQIKQKLIHLSGQHQTLDFKTLVAERDRMSKSLKTKGVRTEEVLTHLVIRRKIEVLKSLIKNAGIPVPESLQNFPALPESDSEYDSELERELALQEIEYMAGKGKKQMTAAQKAQIKAAIEDCLKAKEHTRGARGSTKGTHESGMARRKADKLKRAERIFQDSGFAAALSDAQRC